jgi:hypothetical protein
MFPELLLSILCSMPRAIVLLKLEAWMGLKILRDSRNNPLRISDSVDLSPSLFPEYPNAFAISSTYATPKHPSNLSLVSVNHTIRMINLGQSNLPCDPFSCMLSWMSPSLITLIDVIPFFPPIHMLSCPL